MPKSYGSNRKTRLWQLFAASLILWIPTGLLAQDRMADSHLEQEELKDIDLLSQRFRGAGEEDALLARDALRSAQGFADRDNWGAAFKSYGESAVIRPSSEALAGMAMSISRISRDRPSCADIRIAKLRDLSEAFAYLALAATFGERHNQPVDLAAPHREMVEAQRRIFDPEFACEGE